LLLALATALAGLMNVVSALFPAFQWRYVLLRDLVPVRLINDSVIATAFFGILLILLADGLSKRHSRAMWLTLGILTASAVAHLTKGLDYEEALVCLALPGILFARRSDYVVASRPIRLRNGLGLATSFALLYYAYDLMGFRILSAWITPRPSFAGALLEPLRLIADLPVYHYHGHQAGWFGTSLVVIGSAALGWAAILALRPLVPIHRSNALEHARARVIVRRHGSDTLSYFALRGDRSYFFNDVHTAFLSYKIWRNVALVGGDPIGAPQLLAGLTNQFLEFCDANALTPCFLGANGHHLGLYRSMGIRVLKIGEEALIRLQSFDISGLKRKVRRAERHCLELGMTTRMFDAAALPQDYRDEALRVSKRWVRSKGGAERGFSMTLGRIPTEDDREARVLVALDACGRLIGFLTLVPVFGASGWSLDMMRRRMDAPNGLTEFMVIQAARQLQSEGAESLSLNFASLSSTEAQVSEPRAIASLRRFLFNNLSSVYQLKSLYQFNAKFEPEWSSRYLVYGDLIRSGRIFMAVIQAEDPIRLRTLAAALRR